MLYTYSQILSYSHGTWEWGLGTHTSWFHKTILGLKKTTIDSGSYVCVTKTCVSGPIGPMQDVYTKHFQYVVSYFLFFF